MTPSEALEKWRRVVLDTKETTDHVWFVAFGFFLGCGFLPTDAEVLASEATVEFLRKVFQ